MYLILLTAFITSGCAHKKSEKIDSELVLISVDNQGKKDINNLAITSLDFIKLKKNQQRIGITPAKHSITIMNFLGETKSYTIDAKKGKRYIITFHEGSAWEAERDTSQDDFYDINNVEFHKKNALKDMKEKGTTTTIEYIADSQGLFVERDSLAGKEIQQRAIDEQRAREKRNEEIKRANEKRKEEIKKAEYDRKINNLPIIKQIGQKICKSLKGFDRQILGYFQNQALYGQPQNIDIYITAFTENVVNNKIQIRIAGIRKQIFDSFENINSIDGDINIQINSLIWEDPMDWSPC